MSEENKERKKRSANRKMSELTVNEQRIKYLRQLSKAKGTITRNKQRYEAITPNKISKKPELKETKKEYKRLYKEAEKKREEISTVLKEIDKTIKEAKILKSEGKDTSHLKVKFAGKKGRPKKDPAEVKYTTTKTPGPPLEKNDYTQEELKQLRTLNAKKNGVLAYIKRIDDATTKAKSEGKNMIYDEDEYKEKQKDANRLLKEIEQLQSIVRDRVGKQDVIIKTVKTDEKKPRGRPKKEKPVVEKKPRGRPKKPVVEKRPRGRPKKEVIEEIINNNDNFDDIIEEPVIDRHKIAKKVVSKKLKSIVDEVTGLFTKPARASVLQNIPQKKKVKKVRFI